MEIASLADFKALFVMFVVVSNHVTIFTHPPWHVFEQVHRPSDLIFRIPRPYYYHDQLLSASRKLRYIQT